MCFSVTVHLSLSFNPELTDQPRQTTQEALWSLPSLPPLSWGYRMRNIGAARLGGVEEAGHGYDRDGVGREGRDAVPTSNQQVFMECPGCLQGVAAHQGQC